MTDAPTFLLPAAPLPAPLRFWDVQLGPTALFKHLPLYFPSHSPLPARTLKPPTTPFLLASPSILCAAALPPPLPPLPNTAQTTAPPFLPPHLSPYPHLHPLCFLRPDRSGAGGIESIGDEEGGRDRVREGGRVREKGRDRVWEGGREGRREGDRVGEGGEGDRD